jgi:uroporphyrinogen-III synthase
VIVTGPVEHLADYARAARSAGWEAVEFPVLSTEPRRFDPSAIRGGQFDWVCVTSASALSWLEEACAALPDLRGARCAAVGKRTAERAAALGLDLALPPAADSGELAASIRAAESGGRILWPRGSLSDELARSLREAGFEVEDPIAYTTRPRAPSDPLPAGSAVFFASPSAVRAWHERDGEPDVEPGRRLAIAIGRTTFDAVLQETPARFFDTISLPQPTPEAFGVVLAHLDLGTTP